MFVFLSTQMRREGVYPSSFVFLFIQTRREGAPLLVRVPMQQTRRGGDTPSHLCFYPHRRDEEGISPSPSCFYSHRCDGRGIPLLGVFLFLSTPFDATREGATPSHLLSTAFHANGEGSTPSPLLFNAFWVGLTPLPSFDAV